MTADTSVLVRAMTGDDPRQSKAAKAALADADLVAVTLPTMCELVWVLSRGYDIPSVEIAGAIRRLLDAANVAADRPAAEAGLAMLDAGGDFADGVIAHEGRWLGAEIFASFDRKAVKLMEARSETACLL
jgi:predicted nucleic-acid-binding protein